MLFHRKENSLIVRSKYTCLLCSLDNSKTAAIATNSNSIPKLPVIVVKWTNLRYMKTRMNYVICSNRKTENVSKKQTENWKIEDKFVNNWAKRSCRFRPQTLWRTNHSLLRAVFRHKLIFQLGIQHLSIQASKARYWSTKMTSVKHFLQLLMNTM